MKGRAGKPATKTAVAARIVLASPRQSGGPAPHDIRFAGILMLIQSAHVRAYQAVNTDLVSRYSLARTTSTTVVADCQTMLPSKVVLRRKLHELYIQPSPEDARIAIHRIEGDEWTQTSGGRPRRRKPRSKRKGRLL